MTSLFYTTLINLNMLSVCIFWHACKIGSCTINGQTSSIGTPAAAVATTRRRAWSKETAASPATAGRSLGRSLQAG